MNKKNWLALVFLAVAMALSLCNCNGGDSNGNDGNHNYSLGAIELNNYSNATIDQFYLAPIDQPSWGSNILANFIYPTENLQLTDIDSGHYNAKITVGDPYSDYFAYIDDIPINAGQIYTLGVHDSNFTGSLELHNNSLGANIIGVYVVSVNNPTWGDNQTSLDIPPSGQIHLNDLNPDLYDVRVVWNVGPETIFNNISVNSLALTTLNVD